MRLSHGACVNTTHVSISKIVLPTEKGCASVSPHMRAKRCKSTKEGAHGASWGQLHRGEGYWVGSESVRAYCVRALRDARGNGMRKETQSWHLGPPQLLRWT